MSETVRILGFDPGTRVAGFGVIDASPGRVPTIVDCGAFRLGGARIADRLCDLHSALRRVVAAHRPQVLAVETVFHGKSFESVLKVGEARGIGLLVAADSGLEIAEFPPAQVKKTVTGNGRATKAQVRAMMVRLLRLERATGPSDETDALALAFCYAQRLWRRQLPEREESRATRMLRALREAERKRAAPRGLVPRSFRSRGSRDFRESSE